MLGVLETHPKIHQTCTREKALPFDGGWNALQVFGLTLLNVSTGEQPFFDF